MTKTETRIRCPHCEDHDLKVESVPFSEDLGFLDREPEGDVDGPYFPGYLSTHVIYCEDCGDVTAAEVYDFIWRNR